jgi:Flp pilus assembly protein TadD
MVPNAKRAMLIGFLLAAISFTLYWPATGFDFINYDDTYYVTYNPTVQQGITAAGVRWAFTSNHVSNWHPLTWISHMLDCQWYGLKPAGHHLTNVLFHAANTALLFLVLLQMTGAMWRGALVAALFAWHPLHVESVAWVSERKDLLSTFFWLLTMSAYTAYASSREKKEQKSWVFYGLALVCLALGLLAKPMVVTLPLVLLLLDYWPLQRMAFSRSVALRLMVEKIPFFALAVLDCVATFRAQAESHSVVGTAALPVGERVANTLVSYVLYLWKTVWPENLAVPYPYSQTWTIAQAAGAGALLLAVTGLVFWRVRRQPYLAVGWFWFLGTLVPVIGLVQVGIQFMADRYAYVPLIGIFIMAAWSIPARWARWPRPGMWLAAGTGAILVLLMMVTSVQLLHWHNSVALFSHTVEVTQDNILAEYNLAAGLAQAGDDEDAVVHYRKALAIKPNRVEAQPLYNSQPQAHFNLGLIYWKHDELAEAETQFRACLTNQDDPARPHNALGSVLLAMDRVEEAVQEFQTAAQFEPGNAGVRKNLGAALARAGKIAEAEKEYRESIRLNPNGLEAMNELAWLLATAPGAAFRNGDEAVRLAEHAGKLNGGGSARFLATLDASYAEAGRFDEAITAAEKTRAAATAEGRSDLAEAVAKRLELYRAGKPFHR